MASALPHLLVDGANVLHAWPDLRALLRRDREAARSRLVQRLAAVHDGAELRVTIVFDGRGADLVVERPSGQPTFSVVTTPAGSTADDVIERLVAQGTDPAACRVATADNAVAETVRAAGASVLTPADLADWVVRAETEIARRVARHNSRSPRP